MQLCCMTYKFMVQDRAFTPMAIVVLAVVIFLFDNLREKRSVSLTNQVSHVLKILVAHMLKNASVGYFSFIVLDIQMGPFQCR